VIQSLARRYLRLPPRRCASWLEQLWLPMPDGVRLATLHFWPVDEVPAPTVVMRTPDETGGRLSPLPLLGRLIAESGYHVILQQVRGRGESEGRFTPFADEGADGKATLDWMAEQSWCDGRIALAGVGYPGYAAWAARARAPEHVRAMIVAIGTSDPYRVFYTGGAFSLAAALEWGVGLGRRESVARGNLDLQRATLYRPVREADRIALRKTRWYRDWLDHPRRDAFWDALRPRLPEQPIPTLLLAGWYDLCLQPQLADYTSLAASTGTAVTRLVIGPWSHGRLAHRSFRDRANGMLRVAAQEISGFLDHYLRGEGARQEISPTRFFMAGGGWRDAESWPPRGVEMCNLFLQGGEERTGGRPTGERLTWEPSSAEQASNRFAYDPETPLESHGGALLDGTGGACDQRGVEGRSDVVTYTSAALDRALDIAGNVKLVLHAASSAVDTDFTAVLVDMAPGGPALNVGQGIARARWRGLPGHEKNPVWLTPGEPQRLEIDLGPAAWRFASGHRLRLQISSSDFPRFDRNPNTRDDPARAEPETYSPADQQVYCDTTHRSRLVLPVIANGP
jgi:putative CocE/NonD family hydrolase